MIRGEIIAKNLSLEAGGCLRGARIVYHTAQPCWDGRKKIVWICHALTANSDPEDWWPEMVGRGKVIDTEEYFVVCVNVLGSPYGSEGPAAPGPDGRPRLLDFPRVTVRDIVRTFILVRKHLGIRKIDVLIGSSIGGYQALEWSVMERGIARRTVLIATAPRISPFLGATVEAQRMALEADASFREARDIHGGEAGLRCARAQALVSYRCFEGYGATQAERDEDALFASRVGSYERYQGEKLVARGFDAYSYYTLLGVMDSHNLGRGRGGVEAALGTIRSAVTVVSIDTDLIFPPSETLQWQAFIPGAEYRMINSRFGHDGFLVETARVGAILMKVCRF